MHRACQFFTESRPKKTAPRVVRESSLIAPNELLQAKTAWVNEVSTDL
jgi:hypothetical protein